jgi:hypothetical protein
MRRCVRGGLLETCPIAWINLGVDEGKEKWISSDALALWGVMTYILPGKENLCLKLRTVLCYSVNYLVKLFV